MTGPVLQFRVAGLPRTQGDHIPVLTRHKDPAQRKAMLIERNDEARKAWRAAVKAAAVRAKTDAGLSTIGVPVKVVMLFAIHRGKKSEFSRPTSRSHGDTSKLARSVEDAITDAQVWADDGLITYELIVKDFPGPRVLQTTPGVIVRIWLDEPGEHGQELLPGTVPS